MAKGKNYEREISKLMSLWITNGTDADLIWYTKSSGGRATRRVKRKEKTKRYDFGDLGPDDAKVEFLFNLLSFELKTGYGNVKNRKKVKTLWSLLDSLDGSQQIPTFEGFWNESLTDARRSNREPIVIFRRNYRESCIAMHNYLFRSFIKINKKKPDFNILYFNLNKYNNLIAICNLKHFFEHTWGINENYFNLEIKRTIIQNQRIN